MSSRTTSIGSLDSEAVDHQSSASTYSSDSEEPLISGLHHVNLLVPPQTLHLARDFYVGFLGLRAAEVPSSCKAHLAWFDIASSGQQVHVTSQHPLDQVQMKAQAESPRHLCFKVPSPEKFDKLQAMIWRLYERGGEGAPSYCDEQSEGTSQIHRVGEFPRRFFARDYAGNRLEFTL